MMKILDYTNTQTMPPLSLNPEEDFGVSDTFSIELEVSLKKLLVMLFTSSKKMDLKS